MPGIKNGNEKALQELIRQIGPKLFNYCLKHTGRREDAEELTQDILLKLWRFRDRIDSAVNIEVFLFIVARNHLLNFARKKTGYILTPGGELEQLDHPVEDHQRIDYQALLAQYQRVMDNLGAKRREVFRLSREQGLTNKEISERLGISIRTVETHVSHVLAIMRQEFKDTYVLLAFLYFI